MVLFVFQIKHLCQQRMRLLRQLVTHILTSCARQKSWDTSSSTDTKLRRCLSTLDLTFIGIGSTLGSGIYVLTGEVAKNKAGPAIVLSFLIAAVASVLSGLCYAEFGARIPKAGSAYVYCYLTIGEFCAFVIGWNIIMEYIIGGAAVARAMSAYVDSLASGAIKNGTIGIFGDINVTGVSNYFDIFALSVVLLFTIFLSLGVKNSARFNNVCVAINISTVLLVIFVGLAYAKVENWGNFTPYGFEGVLAGASTCFFAFIGFDVIATTSEEAKNPSRSIPISMIGTITICFLAYFGVSASVTLLVPYTDLHDSSAVATAFHQRGLGFMGYLIGVGATMGLLGCTLMSMIPLPRLLYAMSQDGMVMKFFSKVNDRTGVPVISTVISGVAIGLMAALLDLEALVEMLSIGTLLAYTIVDVCVIVLRYRFFNTYQRQIPIKSESIIGSNLDIQTQEIEGDEFLLLDQSKANQGCFENGCNFQNNPLLINVMVVSIIFILLGLCIVFSKYGHKLLEKDFGFILILLVLLIMLLAACFYLSRLKTNIEGLSFTVPLVPWLPVIALFFNIYLMLELSHLTWIRFGVWMAGGLVVYLGYSMHHSSEKLNASDDEEEYILLENKMTRNDPPTETSPLKIIAKQD
ncbi:cationic amino acid transporter 2-like [Hydractinia symbiolongicarpus]|uniref:cationic amino acid transporter 2-like n=1 Tax=Hydractinia symbiolongicarpus TaxID=13093 RepID=UPI002550EE63|nr:cationic amino acid transporter 2-like [Hydractinia symbiolongicarpus]